MTGCMVPITLDTAEWYVNSAVGDGPGGVSLCNESQ